jgi:hypothetical protein
MTLQKKNSLKTKTNDIVNKNELTNTQSINRTIIEKYELIKIKLVIKYHVIWIC